MLEPFQIINIAYMKCLDIFINSKKQVEQEHNFEDWELENQPSIYMMILVILSFTF